MLMPSIFGENLFDDFFNEDIAGATLVSEGIDANYMDIINYAVFGAIKMSEK